MITMIIVALCLVAGVPYPLIGLCLITVCLIWLHGHEERREG